MQRLVQWKIAGWLFMGLVLVSTLVHAQCISVYPYAEDFEAGPAGWTTGGTNSDWTLGSPSKGVINSAGSGTNCWITGGLSNAPYSGGQRSWLQSPCFDLSSLNYPYLRFLIFWDTERQYDGGNIQFTITNGATWVNLGSAFSPASCRVENWYNAASITNLNGMSFPQEGWSGSVTPNQGSCLGGNGSGQWVAASFCLSDLIGQPNVIFRFTFGSGTSCNDYDGIAIDSFTVSDLVPLPVDFSYVCSGGNSVDFTGSVGECPDAYIWDFGDPSSPSNTSVSRTDNHAFSGPGEYTVSYQIDEPCIGQRTVQRRVIIPELSPRVYPLTCPGAENGAIGLGIGYLQAPLITWNTVPPVFSDSLTGLSEGSYTVTVSGDSACSVSLTIDLGADTLDRDTQLPERIAFCETRELILDPGPYTTYQWSDGSTDPTLLVTEPELYVVTVTDVDGCTIVDSVRVRERCFEGIYLPNAFTPNRDGKNELFKAYARDINGYLLTVYNRSAHPVFVTTDPESGWDGTFEGEDCPSGVYVWSCKYDSPDKKNRTEWGKVLLLR